MVCVWGEWEEFREWKRSKEWFEVGARRRAIRRAENCFMKGLFAVFFSGWRSICLVAGSCGCGFVLAL